MSTKVSLALNKLETQVYMCYSFRVIDQNVRIADTIDPLDLI